MRHIALVGGTSTIIFATFPLKFLSLNRFNDEHASHLQLFPTLITNVDHSAVHARAHPWWLYGKYAGTFPLDLRIVGGVGCGPLCSLNLSKATAPLLAQPPNSAVGDRYPSYLFQYLCCSLEIQQSTQPYCLFDYPFAPVLIPQLQLLIQGG